MRSYTRTAPSMQQSQVSAFAAAKPISLAFERYNPLDRLDAMHSAKASPLVKPARLAVMTHAQRV